MIKHETSLHVPINAVNLPSLSLAWAAFETDLHAEPHSASLAAVLDFPRRLQQPAPAD
jgi:hypothetical protein